MRKLNIIQTKSNTVAGAKSKESCKNKTKQKEFSTDA